MPEVWRESREDNEMRVLLGIVVFSLMIPVGFVLQREFRNWLLLLEIRKLKAMVKKSKEGTQS